MTVSLFCLLFPTGCILHGCGLDVPKQHDVLSRWVCQDCFKEHSRYALLRPWHYILGISSLSAKGNGDIFVFLVIFSRENWILVTIKFFFFFLKGICVKTEIREISKSLLKTNQYKNRSFESHSYGIPIVEI